MGATKSPLNLVAERAADLMLLWLEPIAMVIFDNRYGTRARQIYWHGVQ
jgi:hypothetical protein